MKKTSFVIAILAAALLAGACGKKKDAAAPMTPAAGSGEMGSGSGGEMGSGSGSGSAM
ncbi:MAG TPA: hypothetical protein VFK02_32450 [Kofleriaceae bacterium]|nr:hypothetical protein [Kofleriaceae bacterium]